MLRGFTVGLVLFCAGCGAQRATDWTHPFDLPAEVAVLVTNADAAPVSEAEVAISQVVAELGPNGWRPLSRTGATTWHRVDARGEHTVVYREPLAYDIQVRATSYADGFAYGVPPDAGRVEIVLKRGRRVSGRVVDGDSEVPGAVVWLLLPQRGDWIQREVEADDMGRFEFGHVGPPPPVGAEDDMGLPRMRAEWRVKARVANLSQAEMIAYARWNSTQRVTVRDADVTDVVVEVWKP